MCSGNARNYGSSDGLQRMHLERHLVLWCHDSKRPHVSDCLTQKLKQMVWKQGRSSIKNEDSGEHSDLIDLLIPKLPHMTCHDQKVTECGTNLGHMSAVENEVDAVICGDSA